MIAKAYLEAMADVIDYLNDPHNALGLWIATSGIICGAYFLSPAIKEFV